MRKLLKEKLLGHFPSARECQRGIFIRSDALDLLRAIPDSVVDVVFLDPPFNLGKRYGTRPERADRLSERDYHIFLHELIDESARILKPGGSVFLYHIPKWAVSASGWLADNLTFRHWIAISMKNGFARGHRLYPAHYALLHFSKGAMKKFTRPKIQLERCRHCGQLTKDYGGYKIHVQKGINLSDVWDDVSPVRHASAKTRLSNELPLIIPTRALAMVGTPRGVLVDPFSGTGTSILAGLMRGMSFISGDAEEEFVALAEKRVSDWLRFKKDSR